MMTIFNARGLALAAAATATGISLIGGSIAHASDSGADRHQSSAGTATTQVTFKVVDCDGCTITLGNLKEGEHDGWTSKAKTVKDGRVTFAVPTSLTRGLSVQVRAPWEKGTNVVTNAVFRYQGLEPGDKIGFDRAKQKSKASACWAGTDEDGSLVEEGRQARHETSVQGLLTCHGLVTVAARPPRQRRPLVVKKYRHPSRTPVRVYHGRRVS